MESCSTAPTVLIVDDEPAILAELDALARRSGYRTVTAATAEDALDAVADDPAIGIVMTDVYLPAIDGMEFISILDTLYGQTRPLQFSVMTGNASLELVVQAMRLKAVDFLRKPASRHQCQLALARASARWAEAARANGNAVAATPELPARDSAELRAAAALTPDAVSQIIAARRQRLRFFEDEAITEEVWDMLLEVLLCKLQGSRVSISSLGFAVGVPISTTLRWVRDLTDKGILERVYDPDDGRRSFVELSADTERRMLDCIAAMRASLKLD
jgi:FixJ family two-component response regulator/DNA-binding MarR family transcriptional regulator